MTTLAAVLATALVMGYPIWRRTVERDLARKQRDAQQDRADTLAYVLARRVRPESPLELVRGESS